MNIYIITGASKGLGRALSRQLNDQGSQVVGLSRSKGGTVGRFVECDLSDADRIPAAMDEVFALIDFEQVDAVTLINNAADLSPIVPAGKATPAQIKKCFDINLIAPTILTSIFIHKTRAFQGRKCVVNVTSKAAEKAYFGLSLYCSSKAGMDRLGRCVALEQESQQSPVLMLSVDPGSMDTHMQETIRGASPVDFPDVEYFKGRHNNGELPSPEAVAEFIISCINKEDVVNGGRYCFAERTGK